MDIQTGLRFCLMNDGEMIENLISILNEENSDGLK